jgi:PAS domain S-box-containing protein
MNDFRKFFPLVIILTIVLIVCLSVSNIRKNLIPINALKIGAQQIALGHLNQNVDIQSGDEFEDLACSFNQMSDKLSNQFDNLNLIADIGRKIISISERKELSDTIITLIREYLDFDKGAILLVDLKSQSVSSAQCFGFSTSEKEYLQNLVLTHDSKNIENPIIRAHIDHELVIMNNSDNPDHNTSENDDDFSKFVEFLSLICIPILYEKRPLGVLLLIRTKCVKTSRGINSELLTGIAAQAAVSLTNINSFGKIKESEENFRKIFEHSAAGLMLINPVGRLLDANSYLAEMLGYSKKELLAKSYEDIIYHENLIENLDSQKHLINGHCEADSFETRYLHKDGSPMWVFISNSLFRDIDDGSIYFITFVQDISVQKKVQEENRKLEDQLQQAQKMDSLGILAGGIAHDFNNILSGIVGYSELAMMEAFENQGIRSKLEEVLKASNRASDLVKQILTFSRQNKVEMKPIQISIVVKEAAKLLRATIPANIEITWNISNEPCIALADPTHIHQIVMNLCTNSYHAILEKGSGEIQIDLDHSATLPKRLLEINPEIQQKHRTASYLRLTISDSGQGMSTKIQKRIFEPYFSTKPKDKGTGLGLSVVHGIVKNHGGLIDVKSVQGQGTTIDIFLPRIEQREENDFQPPTKLPSGNEKILLIDDEPDIINIGQAMLNKLGYQVGCNNDPLKALEEFSNNPMDYDLVITDMAMPGITGDKLSVEICKIRPDIPIIISTGNIEFLNQWKDGSNIIKNILMKPITLDKLANIVRKTIDQNRKKVSSMVTF